MPKRPTEDEFERELFTSLRKDIERALREHDGNRARSLARELFELESAAAQRSHGHRNQRWDKNEPWLIFGVIAATVLIILVGWFLGWRSIRPSAPTDSALAVAIDRLSQSIAQLAAAGHTPSTPAQGIGWPMAFLIAAALIFIGIILWGIFNKHDDDFTKILSAVIVGIGGVLAVSKIKDTVQLSDAWGETAFAAIVAMFGIAGLATLIAHKHPHTWNVGPVIALLSVLILAGRMIVPLLERNREQPVQPVVQAVVAKTTLEKVADIRGFPSGVAKPGEESCSGVSEESRQVFEKSVFKDLDAVASAQNAQVTGLIVVASTDNQSLRGACYHRFKTNFQLAQERGDYVAKYVAHQLEDRGIKLSTAVIVTGPTQFGDTDRSADRGVTIFRIVTDSRSTPQKF
jgi:hypothetical protein